MSAYCCCCCCCCCCFSHSAHWLPTRKKLFYTVANPARGLLNREKRKRKSLAAPPPPSPPRAKRKKKKTRDASTFIYRRYASRRYAGGLGPSRIRTRIPTTRQLGQWVSLRKTLRFRVQLQLSQSRCASLFSWRCLAAYGHTYSKSMDEPGNKAANPARGQLSRWIDWVRLPILLVAS